jgi:anti-sigma B factor antagonist
VSADQRPEHGLRSSSSLPKAKSPTAGRQVRPFRITEVDLDPDCREMRVEGELDLSTADQFQKRLDVAAIEDVEVLVCLERCDFIDSTGIAAILLAHKLMAKKGRRLLVCGPSGQVSRILAVTGLDDVGLIYASTDAALAERFGHAVSRPFRAETSSHQKLSA